MNTKAGSKNNQHGERQFPWGLAAFPLMIVGWILLVEIMHLLSAVTIPNVVKLLALLTGILVVIGVIVKKGLRVSWSLAAIPSLILFWIVAVEVMGLFYTKVPIPSVTQVLDSFWEYVFWSPTKQDPFSQSLPSTIHPYTLGLIGPHLWQSLQEVMVGFALALVIAVIAGFSAGFSRGFREYITPLNTVFMSIPAIAWAPLVVLVVPYKFLAVVIVVFIAATSPMIIAIMEGVLTIKGQEVRAARALGAKPMQLFIYVYLPASLPFITAGMRIGFSQAWRALVAAEMLGSIGLGLGNMVNTASAIGQDSAMMLGIVLIGVLSYMFERIVFRRIEKRYETWRLH